MNDPKFSGPKLASRAVQALWNWSKAGFPTVDEEAFQRRLNICLGCPNMMKASNRLAYQLARDGETDPRICVLCGCVISRKARLASETCPDQDPDNPVVNRWGERL
jgi:hypothetical protein